MLLKIWSESCLDTGKDNLWRRNNSGIKTMNISNDKKRYISKYFQNEYLIGLK
jgi:hypothetical protein